MITSFSEIIRFNILNSSMIFYYKINYVFSLKACKSFCMIEWFLRNALHIFSFEYNII